MGKSRTSKVLILVIGQGFSTFSVLLMGAFLSRYFNKTDYATYQQSYLCYQFISPLLLLGIPSALFYFLPRTEDPVEKRRILIDNLTLLGILGLGLCLALSFVGELAAWRFNNEALRLTVPAIAPYALFLFPALALPAVVVCADKPVFAASYQGISRMFMLLIVAGFAFFIGSPLAAVVGTTLSALFVLPAALVIMFKVTPGGWHRPRWSEVKVQFKYAAPLGIGTIIGVMNLNLDKMVVSSLSSPEQFAIYTNGAFEIPILALISSQVGAILQPELAKASLKGNLKDAHPVWSRSITKTSLLTLPVMAFCLVTAEELMVFLFSDVYRESAKIFMVYLCLLPVRTFQFGGMFAAMNKGKVIIVRGLISLFLNLGLSWVLVAKYGPVAAAYATVLVVFFFTFPFCLFYAKKWMGVSWRSFIEFRKIGVISLFVLASSLGVLLLKMTIPDYHGGVVQVAILGILFFGSLLIMIRVFGLKKLIG